MYKTREIEVSLGAARSRSVLLWCTAAALALSAVAVAPDYAFAKAKDDVPKGKLTLVENDNSGNNAENSADNNSDSKADTSSNNEASTSEPSNNSENSGVDTHAESQAASSNPETLSEEPKQQDSTPSVLPAESNSEATDSREEVEPQATETVVEPASSEEPAVHNESASTDAPASNETSAVKESQSNDSDSHDENTASNNQAEAAQADPDEVGKPSTHSEETTPIIENQVDDKSLEDSDVHNNSPGAYESVYDISYISTGIEDLPKCSSNDEVASDKSQHDSNISNFENPDGVTGSLVIDASTPFADELANLPNMVIASDDSNLEIASSEIDIQATYYGYTARIWFDVRTTSSTAGTAIEYFGAGDDYIYDVDGFYLNLKSGTFTYRTVSNNDFGTPQTFQSRYIEVTLDGTQATYNTVKKFLRYSYTNTNLYGIYTQTGSTGKVKEGRVDILPSLSNFQTLSSKKADGGIVDIVPDWGSEHTWVVKYRPLEGFSDYTDNVIRNGIYYPGKTGTHVDDSIDIPDSSFNEAMYPGHGDEIGWYVISNKELNAQGGNGVGQEVKITSTGAVAQPGAHKITSGATIWSIVKNAYDIKTTDIYNYDLFFGQFDEFGGTNNGIVIAAATGGSNDLSFTIQYYSTDADGGSASAVGSAVSYSSATAAAKKPTEFENFTPSAEGYTVTFVGWAASLNNDGKAETADILPINDELDMSLRAGLWGSNTPANNGEYSLYAVWEKSPQKFTVYYYPIGTDGFATAPENPREKQYNVPDANAQNSIVVAENASDLWGTRSGYSFLGWTTDPQHAQAGTKDYDAGTSLRTINGSDVDSTTKIYLYAVWQDNNYTVIYEANGGTGTISNPYRYAPNTTTKLTDMPILTREGFDFDGWSEDGTKVAENDGTLTDGFITDAQAGTPHTLTAIWKEIEYTINWYTRWDSSGAIAWWGSGEAPEDYPWQSKVGSQSSSTKLAGLHEAEVATPNNTESSPNYYRQTKTGTTQTLQFKGWYLIKSGVVGEAWDTPATGTVALGDSNLGQAINTLKQNNVSVGRTINVYGIWEIVNAAKVTYSTNDDKFNEQNSAYKGQTWNGTVTTTWTDNPFAGDPYVIDGKQFDVGYSFSGRHFVSWNTKSDGTGTTYVQGQNIASITTMQLYAQWENNTVTIELYKGASDSTIELHAKDTANDPPKIPSEMAAVVKPSDLVTATPYRDNYEFMGWKRGENGTTIVLGPDESNTYTISATDASSDGATIKLYAVWQELSYSVSYYANAPSGVTFRHTTGTQETESSPYTWAEKTKRSDTGLDQPDIDASREWYTHAGWAVSASATASDLISSTANIGQLLEAAGESSRALKLYAVWTPITFTVNYEAKGTHGSVTPVTEIVNLATGQNSDVTGSTATADTANGWQLKTPTWTDVNGNAVKGCDTDAAQALYKPTIAYLQELYKRVPGSASVTFYANFEEQSLAYTIDAYLQQANGNYLSKGSPNWGHTISGVGGTTFTAKLGTVIKATGEGAQTFALGDKLYTLAEIETNSQSTSGVLNTYLYTLDADKTNNNGKQEITIVADTTKNTISLYYARTVYDLSASFQTKNASGAVVKNDKPDGATDVNPVNAYVNSGASTTGLRWGQSVAVSIPSTTGYTFEWDISNPASATSTVPGPSNTSFALSAKDMETIVKAAATGTTPTASLLGTFQVKTVTVIFDDNVANSSHDSCWTGTGNAGTVASALMSGNYTYEKTKVAYNDTLEGWVPDFQDSNWQYYFAGWYVYDPADPNPTNPTTYSKSAIEAMTNWTTNTTFKALWLPKLLITYSVGDPDSNNASKAAWSTASKTLSTHDPGQTIAQTAAKFTTVVTGGEGDDGKPKGAPGWVFDYWTLEGTSGYRIGHKEAYPSGSGYVVEPSGLYVNGATIDTGFKTDKSYTFVAHWIAAPATLTVNTEGPVVNNEANHTGNHSGTLPTGLPAANEYVTDQHIVLSNYIFTSVDNGYELAGWAYTYTPSAEAAAAGATASSGTYDISDDFHLLPGTTVLTPRFNEKTVTFTYAVAPESNGRGSVNGTGSETVFVVTHNGVTTHTAQVTTADGYEFVNWTLNGNEVQKNSEPVGATLTADDLSLTGVLSADRTYYANFKVKQYWVRFNKRGTDGTNTMGSNGDVHVALDSSKTGYSAFEYGYLVDYNTGVPVDSISVTAPEGYELDGWIINGTGGVEAPSGTAENLQGVYNIKPTTADITLTAHFKVSNALKYTVKYVYDPEGISGFTHTETSRVMAWGDEVYPQNENAKNPTANGYNPLGWKIGFDGTANPVDYGDDVSDVGNAKFGAIYNRLIANQASNVDTGTKTITIYFEWEALKYRVEYDFYGNVPNDTGTTNDDVKWTETGYNAPNANVTWNDKASTFWRQSITRVGYTLDHFTATVNTGTGVSETSANVGETDTYGKLATATDGTIYATVTLRAFWKSVTYDVLYDYNYKPAGSSSTRTETKQHGWAEDVDFFTEGAAPMRDGWRFSGWQVSYTGNDYENHLKPDIKGATLTSAGATTIRDLRNGDIALVDGTANIGSPAVTLTALWVQEANYYFQDSLIWADGTSHDVTAAGGKTPTQTVAGNSTVNFASYGYANGKTTYEGFDFDNHNAVTPEVPVRAVYTKESATATQGSTLVYHVYYLERTYTLNFKVDGAVRATTSNNPYTSAAPNLSTVATPTKAGWTFAGWYLTDGTNRVRIDGSDPKKISDLYTTAPDRGSALDVVADWTPQQVEISWASGDNGSVSSAVTSPDKRSANSTDAAAAIYAIPESTDYVFEKWTYSYTDDNGILQTGDVVAGVSEFATLAKSDPNLTAFDILTPKQWNDGLWHDIAFTAHFVTSSALRVRIEYYLEKGDTPGTYEFKEYETRSDASDNEVYTVTNPKAFAGYVVNSGHNPEESSHTYKLKDDTTHTFKVYYDANTYNVSYRFVVSDAAGAATQTDIPSGVGLPTDPYTGTFRTGQTVTVAPVPTAEGWTFAGWYKNRATGAVANGTVAMPADNLEFVGIWSRVYRIVRFINDNDPASAAVADGTTVSMSSLTGYSVAHGTKVKTSSDAQTANATTLVDFGVTANNNNKGWKLGGWKVMDTATSTWLSSNVFSSTQVLDYEPVQNVTFVAQWIETYAVTYDPGMHGAFGTKSYGKIDITIPANTVLNVDGTTDADHAFYGNDDSGVPVFGADGKPKANLGYEFAGWGVNNGTWTYYFEYNENIDYGMAVSAYGSYDALPTTITGNIDFVAFFIRLPRTVQFMETEYDGTAGGTLYDPPANISDSDKKTQTVRTGLYATMLSAADIQRTGYKLDHWTSNGTDSYTPGSNNEFQMGEYADGTIVRLYPVFSYDTIEIYYVVATDQGDWGSVDRPKDVKTSSSSIIVGSKATANPGYTFVKWTLKDSEDALGSAAGLQGDGVTLKPSAAGIYVAHFVQKEYTFSADVGDFADAQNVTAPTRTDGTEDPNHWTDSMTLGTPTLAGYTFTGWDVYEAADYGANGTGGTKLHAGMAGYALVSALSNAAGTAQALVLVPTFEPLTYQVVFDTGDTDGDHKVDANTMPAAYSGAYDGTVNFAAPERVGWQFRYWTVTVTTTSDSSTLTAAMADTSALSDDHATYKTLAGNDLITKLTLTAVWQADAHTLSYGKVGIFEEENIEGIWSSIGADYPATNDPAHDDAAPATKAEDGITLGTDTVITLRGAATLTKEGYKLLGWNDGSRDYLFDDDGAVSFTMPNGDAALTPIWDQPGEYSVVFVNGTADGAAVADEDIVGKPIDRTEIRYSVSDILTGKPALKGYAFLGWDAGTDGVADVTDYTTPKTYASLAGSDAVKTVVLTALWQKRTDYVVTFEPGATAGVSGLPYGSESTPYTKTGLSWNSDVTTLAGLPAAAPTRSGWAFDGWKVYTDAEHMHQVYTVTKTGESFPETVVFSMLANNIDAEPLHLYLEAQWTEIGNYSVTFNANGDGVSRLPESQGPLTWGAIVTTRHNDGKPVRAGYAFNGWTVKDALGNELRTGYDDVSATYEYLANGTDVPQIVLWAQWTPKSSYSVQFDANAGGDSTLDNSKIPTSPQSDLTWGASVTTLKGSTDADKPTRNGYTFAGWSVYASDGTTMIGDAARVTGASYAFSDLALEDLESRASLLLRAEWTPVLNTLTYHLPGGAWSNGSTGDAAEQHGSGTDVTLRAKTSVTRDGYKLVGWQDSDPDGGTAAEHAYYVDSVYAGEHGLSVTETFLMPVTDYALWPIWDVMTYTAHFADGVASGALPVTESTMPTDPQTVAYDGTVSHAAPTRTGYTFEGWVVYRTTEIVDGAPIQNATILATVAKTATESVYSALAKSVQIDEITLIAQWLADKKKIAYVLTDGEGVWVTDNITDGGETTLIARVEYDVDADVTLRAEDTVHRNGYVLVGWQTSTNEAAAGYALYRFDEDDDTPGEAHLIMPSAHVQLYPKWELRSYKVTFDGNAPTGSDVVAGAVLDNMPSTQPAANDTLTWSGDKSLVSTKHPTFTGWEFRGWTVYDMNGNVVGNTQANNGTPLMGSSYNYYALAGNEDLVSRRELKLVANWRLYTYTVVFADGVDAGDTPITGSLPADYEGAYGGTVSYYDLTRTGYTFNGWDVVDITNNMSVVPLDSIAAGETSAVFYALAKNNDKRFNLKLTAKWIEKQGYYVTFVGKEDAGVTVPDISGFNNYTNIYWDDTVTVYSSKEGSEGKPTRIGYTFGSERTVNGQKQLAGWVVRNTTDADNPVSIGYVLVSNIGTFHYAGLAVNPSTGRADDTITHITLTALWTPNPHTVTYQIGDAATWIGSAIDSTDPGKSNPAAAMNYATDDVVDPIRGASTAKRAGYTLTGWNWTAIAADNNGTSGYYSLTGDNPATRFTVPDADVVLVAEWTPKTYTITFDAGKPGKATDALQTVTNVPDTIDNAKWDEDADLQVKVANAYAEPKLAGWKFDGWVIEYAEDTGANTNVLSGTTYKYRELALTDTGEHAVLNLIATWKELPFRLIYVDPVDDTGTALATPTVISNTVTTLWNDAVSTADPWTVVTPAYEGKTNDDWQFDGWLVYNATTREYELLDSEHMFESKRAYEYRVLADKQGLTVADVAVDGSDTPALVLYATWTRRVPFIVEFVKQPVAEGLTNDADTQVIESTMTVKGLDGDSIADAWATTILGYGSDHHINGYEYDFDASEPGMVGTLVAGGETIHLQLYYNQILDYVIIYDASPGKNGTGATLSSKRTPAWDTPSVYFEPDDTVWAYTGHKIDHWAYGPTGTEYQFEASDDLSFADIAEAIYGTVDGSQGIAANGMVAKPVTLHAIWVERADYKVQYDNNYSHITNGYLQDGAEVKIGSKFIERIAGATFTPDDLPGVVWSSTDLAPSKSVTDQIVAPGVKNGKALYEIAGWNYSTDNGATQYAADGKKFSEIVEALNPDGSDLESAVITLYARWQEIAVELTYSPVVATVDEHGNVTIGSGTAGGQVSRTSEIVSAVTGGTTSGTKLIAEGATAIANPGFHFYGWRRASDQEIVYAPGMDPSGLTTQAAIAGFNVLPDGSIDGTTLFAVAQNTDDGYWHSEEYQALFVQNDMAILHYDKNASDAAGSIADVEAPYGSLLTLSDGSVFSRTYWTLVSWNTQADGAGTTYELSQASWPLPEGETTLYAMWKKNTATLSYEPNGDGDNVTGMPESVTDEWGTSKNVPTSTPSRKHYTFKGWNTSADGTGTAYEAGSEIDLPGDGVKLYAQWELNKFSVSVSTGGVPGTVTSSDGGTPEIEYGGYLPEGYYTVEPEDGYHLTGWKYTMVDEDGNVTTGVVDDPSDLAIIGEVTFEPIFEADKVESKTNKPTTDPADPTNNTKKQQQKKQKQQSRSNTGTRGTSAPTAAQGNYLAKTADNLTAVSLALIALLIASLMLLLIARRKTNESARR